MELRQLRYFVCVAQMKNISRAAARLNVAQPALSRQIRKLESELGVSLLKREVRGVGLTKDGSVLLDQASALINQADQLVESFNAKGRIGDESLTIALPDWMGRMLIAPVLERFRQKYPHGALHVKVGLSGSIREWVVSGEADVGLVPNAEFLEHGMLDFQLLFREPLVLVGPNRKHNAISKKLARMTTVGFEEIQQLPLILAGSEHGVRRLIDSIAKSRGFKLKTVLEVDNFAILTNFVREGRGYTLLAASGVAEDVKLGRLRSWRIRESGCEASLWLARLKTSRPTGALTTLIRALQSELTERGYRTA